VNGAREHRLNLGGTMYTHVSKCKNDKIKREKNKIKLKWKKRA
jgi:hypothetical protein